MPDTVAKQLNDLTIQSSPKSTNEPLTPKYDRNALKERYKILGRDPEQSILNAVRQACHQTFLRDDFGKTLQSIKANFVQRDYEGIFTADANSLAVYSAAYVPGRALCYFEIFSQTQFRKLLAKETTIYAVGSGSGSELVSLAAAMTRSPAEHQKVNLVMQDLGDWAGVLKSFEATVRKVWKISDQQLLCTYEHGDVLDPAGFEERNKKIQNADLITFMFVMNELFVKKASAMELIQSLVRNMKKGAHLLVVESAGSFSHLKVGGKTYMVYMLLDAIKDLRCIIAEDSRWYRHPEHLKYVLDVQNMRYFIRLYKKI